MTMNILKVFTALELEQFEEHNENQLRGACPGGCKPDENYPFIIFIDTNTAYCYQSKNTFNPLELIALKNGLIDCNTKQSMEVLENE